MSPQKQNNSPAITCAIIDAACIFGDIDTVGNLQSNFLSLFMKQGEELLSSVAPYLFPFHLNTEFAKWLVDKGWGNGWGMFLTTTSSIEDLRKHFRKFLMVKTEDGNEIYFRFYDPAVLRKFLPSCDQHQLMEFFGPVLSYAMEDADPEFALIFSLDHNKLKSHRISKHEFWKQINNGVEYIAKTEKPDFSAHNNPQATQPDTASKPETGWSFLID